MKLREYLNESMFSKGDKVEVINKDDDDFGKKGVVYKVSPKKEAQTVKLEDGSVSSFGNDELKKI